MAVEAGARLLGTPPRKRRSTSTGEAKGPKSPHRSPRLGRKRGADSDAADDNGQVAPQSSAKRRALERSPVNGSAIASPAGSPKPATAVAASKKRGRTKVRAANIIRATASVTPATKRAKVQRFTRPGTRLERGAATGSQPECRSCRSQVPRSDVRLVVRTSFAGARAARNCAAYCITDARGNASLICTPAPIRNTALEIAVTEPTVIEAKLMSEYRRALEARG